MNKRAILKYIIILLVGVVIFINQCRYMDSSNKLKCEIVKDEIKGIVSSKTTEHTPSIFIDNKKKWYTIAFPLSDTCFVIKPGDSIIKESNSKTILIKRGNLQCASEVRCKD
jgi:hypothetical protein